MSMESAQDLGVINDQILIFGGPYSNLQATEAVLGVAQQLGIPQNNIVCTGDVVAYAAQPEATTQLIQAAGIHVVMGNCEEALATDQLDCGCGFDQGMQCSLLAVNWYNYAKQQVSAASKQWMGDLPKQLIFRLNGVRCSVIHGSFNRLNDFVFSSSAQSIKAEQYRQTSSDVVIAGHSGLPFGEYINMGEVAKLWLNAGVIGLPANDGTPEGWYLLLTPLIQGGIRASWHRLAYDYKTCHNHMMRATFHDYAQTITTGLWPSMDVLPELEQQQQGIPLNPMPMDFPPF